MRRSAVAATVAVASLAVLAGCTPPVPALVTAPAAPEPAAVIQTQVDRIVPATFAELAAADEALDASLLGARVGEPVATIRGVQYALRDAGDEQAVTEIPSTMQAVYVSAEGVFPRVMVGVSEPAEDSTPVVLMWVQEDVESDYALVSWAHMIPGASLPAMPGTATGSNQLPLDTDTLAMTPGQAVTDYVTLLTEGEGSDLAETFEPDTYRDRLFEARKALDDAAKQGDGGFKDSIGARLADTFAMATADGGALVFAPIAITSRLAVTNGATVSISDADRALVEGTLEAAVTHTYSDFVVIHIPADPEAKPAVVAADHHLVRVQAK